MGITVDDRVVLVVGPIEPVVRQPDCVGLILSPSTRLVTILFYLEEV